MVPFWSIWDIFLMILSKVLILRLYSISVVSLIENEAHFVYTSMVKPQITFHEIYVIQIAAGNRLFTSFNLARLIATFI